MSDFVYSALNGLAFVAGAIAIVLGSYFLARRLLHSGHEGDRTHEAAGSVAVRVAALHGLIIGLVYAQELDDYKGVRSVLTEEAVAISDVYNDARRYGGEITLPVQAGLATYLATVVTEEWPMLGRKEGLSPAAWKQWEGVYDRLLNLTPATDRERFLSGKMRDRISAVARLRQMREATAAGRFTGVFWAPAVIGLALVSAPFYIYRPSKTHLILLSMFGAYSGIILFFIFAFANPFEAPGKLQPVPFEQLLKGEIGKSLPSGVTLP
ncbi:bestrophin-like domain [Pararhizobium sp.]|uniref:bestrophin-like domain n=1 Tax=Pararhizobium sp. TaxID=1977563 RepID=UPI00271D23E5|nr:hypothetical protein [Pararhizobium sp.]MDO9418776.1 DUF4239 domain-containing protein [Pararhizobium sp.]